MKVILFVSAFSAAMLSSPVQAGHKEDCDRPEYAQQYGAGFSAQVNQALDKFKAQDNLHRTRLDAMKSVLVKSGVWTDMEGATFMAKAAITDEDAKAAEAERKKAASDFKVQLLSIDGIPMIAGGNKAAEVRATCLLGPGVFTKADALIAASERAWTLLESKVIAVAQAKNVTLP